MVLVVLAIVWAAVLIPPMLRARAEGSPADSIGNFRHQLKVLQRAAPRAVAPANTLTARPAYRAPQAVPTYRLARTFTPESSRRARTLRRRRDVLFALMAGMGLTFLLALLPGFGMLWGAHLLIDAAFVAYIAMLVRMRNVAAEREMKLRFLPGAAVQQEPALALRRSAN